jgi:hypothetical protein
MTITVRFVDQVHVHAFWATVEPFLAVSIEHGEGPEDYNIHHVQQYLTSGHWLLLVGVDENNVICGAAAVSFASYPLHRVAFVTAIGGKFIVCKESFEQMKSIVKQHGATKVQCYVRPAMQRFLERFGFEPGSRLVEVVI